MAGALESVSVVSKPTKRSVRVADQIRMEVADILGRKCKDPRLQRVTVTDVAMNSDLRVARVYVSLLGPRGDVETIMKILKNAVGFVRLELGRRLDLRYTPEVQFRFDDSGPQDEKIGRILNVVLPVDEESEGVERFHAGSDEEKQT